MGDPATPYTPPQRGTGAAVTRIPAENGLMDIELLHIDDCPSWVDTRCRLEAALRATGFGDTPIRLRVVTTGEEAARLRFAGSPTILLDGADLFPGGEPASDVACRVYATPTGLAGLPTTEQLIDAIASRAR